MIKKAALIIDKRKEQSIKYKKILENTGINVFPASDALRALDIINKFEPDLILVSDSIDFDIKQTIEQIRILTYNTRPIIIALSKSSRIQDKIELLDSGADDFLSEPLNRDEFKARISAHMRRNFENRLSEKTMLFDSKISYKMLKRAANSMSECAFMLIDINNMQNYREIYGSLAADKLLQTCSAVIKSALTQDDYTGHLFDENFIVITNTENAEKIANYIIYNFDNAVSKFYSQCDKKRGFIFLHGNSEAETKSDFVSLNIGIITNKYTKYNSIKHIINSLTAVHKLAKQASNNKKGSSLAIERLKLPSSGAEERCINKNILVLEPDESLAVLLEASMRLQGYNVKTADDFSSIDALINCAEEFEPAVVILDAGSALTFKGLDICRKLKSGEKSSKFNIILTDAVHNKEAVLNAGADLYLPKPYELAVISGWVRKFIEDYNN